MLDVCLLGTGGTMPLPERHLTSLMVRYKGRSLLIDCGEGTQVAIKEQGWSMNPIDVILFTHCHADHIAGLPGLILTMAKQGRTKPVRIIGPKGLKECVKALCVIVPKQPFETEVTEIDHENQRFFFEDVRIEAFGTEHSIPCFGYTLAISRKGKFDLHKALTLGIEKKYWGRLQKGETLVLDGNTYTPDLVLGPERKGIKLTYCTDTRPTENITMHAKHSDLFVCEGMYGDDAKLDKALEYKHMLFSEAAMTAKKAEVKELWLTHYSPSMPDPREYLSAVKKIFQNTIAPKNRQSTVLKFE